MASVTWPRLQSVLVCLEPTTWTYQHAGLQACRDGLLRAACFGEAVACSIVTGRKAPFFARDFPPALHPSPIFSLSSVLFSSLSFPSSPLRTLPLLFLFLSFFCTLPAVTDKKLHRTTFLHRNLMFFLHFARVVVPGFYTCSTLFHVCYTVFLRVSYSALRTQASGKQGYYIIYAYAKQKSLHTAIFADKSL